MMTEFAAWQETMLKLTGKVQPREVYDREVARWEAQIGPIQEGNYVETKLGEEGSEGMEGDARVPEAAAVRDAGGLAERAAGEAAAGTEAERRVEANLAETPDDYQRRRIREHLEGDMKLTEHEYIAVSNLARVRMMGEILGKLHPIWSVLPADDLMLARVQISRWEVELEDEVNRLMGKKKERHDA